MGRIEIKKMKEAIHEILDSYGYDIVPGHILRAICLERMGDNNKGQKLELVSKDVLLYVRRALFSVLRNGSKEGPILHL